MRTIRTDAAPAPVAGAPYSQAVAAGPGELVWVSGQVPVEPGTGRLVEGDVGAQTALALRHVAAILGAAGPRCRTSSRPPSTSPTCRATSPR